MIPASSPRGRMFASVIVPPCDSMIRRQVARPRPRARGFVERNGRKYLPNPVPLNLATVQHYDDRLHPHRGIETSHRVERTTLYCWECNNRESSLRQSMVPKVLLRAKARLGHRKKRRNR